LHGGRAGDIARPTDASRGKPMDRFARGFLPFPRQLRPDSRKRGKVKDNQYFRRRRSQATGTISWRPIHLLFSSRSARKSARSFGRAGANR
jgi:hypothetical protein